ncbi:C39 family peptidase [Lederbergia graminis]|nr:C39 family peptidase [Bacillaceae bacterium]
MDTIQLTIIVSTIIIIFLIYTLYRRYKLLSAIFSMIAICSIVFSLFIYKSELIFATELEEGRSNVNVPLQNIDELSFFLIKDKVLIDAPLVNQLPELPRGCEVTSLSMLLASAGVEVDKMKLAEEVIKDPTPRTFVNGKIHFGNPYNGFVGNMYTFKEPGLGVYHGPIMKLAENYLPGRMIDLTGKTFDELRIPLSDGRPVWVIINAQYRELEDSYFQTWHTPDGEIKITMKEHSVLVTGYDDKYVYFNDPLTGVKNKKAPIADFKKAWVQMGSQAITYSHE